MLLCPRSAPPADGSTAGWLETAEERQVRKMQFMALIERRNAAAHHFLQPEGDASRLSVDQQKPLEAAPRPSGAAPLKSSRPSDVTILNAKVSQELSEADLAIDRSPQALTNPMFEIRNFLMSLGLK